MNAAFPPPLSDFTPPLPETLVANLAALNIRTAPDLIFTPPAEVARTLPAGSITFLELTRYIAHVTRVFAGPAVTGDEVIKGLEESALLESVRSGLPALDELVANSFGGASGGRVVEISGASATGKTTLALHIILHHLDSCSTDAALWLDSTGDFSPTRLTTPRNEPAAHLELLTRLNIASAFDTAAAVRAIEALDKENSTNNAPRRRQFRIVVLDTLTVFLGPLLSGLSSQGHAEMTMFMRLLRATAQKHGLCILVLNDATAAGHPALGAPFTFMTDVTLWLARAQGDDRELRTVEVLRSRVSAPVINVDFDGTLGVLLSKATAVCVEGWDMDGWCQDSKS
ncbi:P-loop containing nucleoside triphosphate hydrolase protein [Multifurca ochricompacta]|uniref:P-loop containing nucleoside triphosphate hydrolase protein n=1 Tax=Multifurca ochricompacta TaxID=376703 RepID=A0AAD4M686_9AGAM|nr:P-loop containing nucleoside triphosphate hydrolase protein [Multifurca ochricompacta]